MKKDAYYFPHFSNARNDSKLIKLRRIMGIEGYGMYFLLLEILREQTDFKLPLSNLEDLAYEWHTSKEKLLTIVTNFELFEVIEDKFFSPKLVLYLQPYIEKSERARTAALKRWNSVKSNANALQMHSGSNANKNARKGKERKVNKSSISISHDFYKTELESSKVGEKYLQYNKFYMLLCGKTEFYDSEMVNVLEFEKQVSYIEFCKLLKKSKINGQADKKLSQIVMTMANDNKYTKGKTSLYLTINNWLNRDFK